MRLAYYAGASTAAAAACLLKAFHERPNFYSATVYLSQSNACLLILTNLILVCACTFMYGLQRLLYGPLRPIEIEQLSEKAWYAVLDTLLAMPSFREDLGGWLLAMFTLLLAGKVWGWIGEGKVDVLEQQPPANPRLFHARLATSLVVSVVFDIWMLIYCLETVLADPRPGMMVIFTFEFAVLTLSSIFTFCRYGLSLVQASLEKQQMKKAIEDRKDEIRAERAAARQTENGNDQSATAATIDESPIEVDENEVDIPGWEEKRRWLFILEVVIDFLKLAIYCVFFFVSITFNGLPMHIMRDVYMTFASFSKRVADYLAYRRATSDMNTRYPDATTEEIRGDACIVCRESMVAWEQPNAEGQPQPAEQQPAAAPAPVRRMDEGLRAKKLPCGHILHLRCLKAWLERQQVCPTCRRPVVVAPTSATGGQPGAGGGANQGAVGQQGRQPAQRGRAQIFNFGPLRIGFLRGPGDQLANIVRQLQNQPGAAGQNGGQPANQQGPNHLGLQVPYADGQQGASNSTSGPQLSTQARLRQIELRLMQDAQNLTVESQQLNVLRAMEVELERLRSLHQPTAALTATQNQQGAAQQQPPRYAQVQPMAHFHQPYIPIQPQQAFQGNTNQQYGSGHEHLPAGMTLPEGWTVMPLHRTNEVAVNGQPVQARARQPVPSQATAPEAAAANGALGGGLAESSRGDTAGPVDDNGSPLFVPTQPATNGTNLMPSENPTQSQAAQPESESLSERQTSWNSGSWSFDEQPNGNSNGGDQPKQVSSSAQPSANGAAPESEWQNDNGKGKAKAVEVEDAPDTGD